MRTKKKDVFLCHASVDKEAFVTPLAHQLDRYGISYWLDEAQIRWGDKIANQINKALNTSRFVVIFLSDSFVGRNWTETELSAALARENAEGRTVVLTIVIGNEEKLLTNYPLLRDKKYLRWSDGEEIIVDQLQYLIFISEIQPKVNVPIKRTRIKIPISPDLTLRLLTDLDPHMVYAPEFICSELEQCGFVATWFRSAGNIDINGISCASVVPDIGESGIWSLDLARVVFRLVTGKQYVNKRLGRGSNYRVLLRELRAYFVKVAAKNNSDEPPSSSKGNVATGKYYSGLEKMGMAAADLGAQLTLYGIPISDPESNEERPASIPLLIGSAISLLLESGQEDPAHELRDLERIMTHLLRREPRLFASREQYDRLLAAVRAARSPNRAVGLAVPDSQLEAWERALSSLVDSRVNKFGR